MREEGGGGYRLDQYENKLKFLPYKEKCLFNVGYTLLGVLFMSPIIVICFCDFENSNLSKKVKRQNLLCDSKGEEICQHEVIEPSE